MRKRSTQAALVVALLSAAAALPAEARYAGHPGATGRPGGGTCNRCHSPQTYDGLEIKLPDEYAVHCWESDGQGGLRYQQTLYAVPYGAQIDVSLLLAEPPQGTPDGSTVGVFCPEGDSCQGPVAGFGVEVQGTVWREGDPFPLQPAAGESTMKQAFEDEGDPGSPTEVIHSQPRAFAGGEVKWGLVLRTPEQGGGNGVAQSLTLYASANACNGNGEADVGDITAVASRQVYFQLGDDGARTGPTCIEYDCADIGGYVDPAAGGCVCPEGAVMNEEGVCVAGCGCRAASSPEAGLGWAAALALFGLVLRRRRR